MFALSIIIDVILILISIVLIIAVLMQQGQKQGLGAIGGGAETFLGKNAASSAEGKLKLITKIAAVIFIILALVATIVTAHINGADVVENAIVEELEDGSHVHEDGTVHDAEGNVVEATETEETAPVEETPAEPVNSEEPAVVEETPAEPVNSEEPAPTEEVTEPVNSEEPTAE